MNEKGISLIELMVGVALISIIGAGIFSIMYTSNRIYSSSSSRIDSATYAREISSAITTELRYATIVHASGSTLQYTITSSGRQITLDTKQHALIANGRTIASGQVESLAFTATNNNGKAVVTATFNLYGNSNNSITVMTVNPAKIE